MDLKRVVITGLGALTPIGNSIEEYWNGLASGVSGAGMITRFDASKFKTQFACELKNFNTADHFDRKEARKYDPYAQYGLIAANQAYQDAGIKSEQINLDRAGVIWSSGIGGLDTFEKRLKITSRVMEHPGSIRFSSQR
jgi:3-oxoacyl-[acyl-carrier-protein] synthase II